MLHHRLCLKRCQIILYLLLTLIKSEFMITIMLLHFQFNFQSDLSEILLCITLFCKFILQSRILVRTEDDKTYIIKYYFSVRAMFALFFESLILSIKIRNFQILTFCNKDFFHFSFIQELVLNFFKILTKVKFTYSI